ncbi:hypothetical protein C1O33_11870 [Staphylococcus schleiferi]|nr:hypothetical protein [Staphylococcus schleiferi]NHB71584.1 hypothetical protein [Staphylococcus sp. 191]
MKKFINNYYFTLIFLTLLVFFSITFTSIFTKNQYMYMLMSFVILLSTFPVEIQLNKHNNTKEKGRKLLFSIVPINIIVFLIFTLVIFK